MNKNKTRVSWKIRRDSFTKMHNAELSFIKKWGIVYEFAQSSGFVENKRGFVYEKAQNRAFDIN